jgi:hypothetical protein
MEFITFIMTYSSVKDFCFVVRGLVSKEVCSFVSQEIKLMEQNMKQMYPQGGIEPDFEESFSFYGPFCLETLSLEIQDDLEKHLQTKLYPSYTYGRIYRTGAKLKHHLDRRSSEYTLSINLEDKENVLWPMCVQLADGTVVEEKLQTGDAIVYSGRDQLHWRPNEFKGKEIIQAFIQYVDTAGDSSDLKWDGRPLMGMPFETTNHALDHNFDRSKDIEERLKSIK